MRKAGYLVVAIFLSFVSCKKVEEKKSVSKSNEIQFAEGLEITNYNDFTVMKITKPWPEATKTFTYVCAASSNNVPDSLAKYTFIQTPVQNLVVTSTTHISSLVALNQQDKLIGFPNLNFISSSIVRKMIDEEKIMERSEERRVGKECRQRCVTE